MINFANSVTDTRYATMTTVISYRLSVDIQFFYIDAIGRETHYINQNIYQGSDLNKKKLELKR